MYSSVPSAAYIGLHGYVVHVETHIAHGLPRFKIVGLPGKSVEEAKERVSAAIKSSGYTFPLKRITVNLSPTDIPKQGSLFDLSIALSILIASSQVYPRQSPALEKTCFAGELGLDGSLRSAAGLPILIETALEHNFKNVIVPHPDSTIFPNRNTCVPLTANSLSEVITFLEKKSPLPVATKSQASHAKTIGQRLFDSIAGNNLAKRAVVVAIAGKHSILLSGPPGCGKTLLAQSAAELIPPPSTNEKSELAKIYSLTDNPFPETRPFRNPAHNISKTEFLGGGTYPLPGEATLAHNGTLFLDEFPEFSPEILRSLRSILDRREIIFSRKYATISFPSDFLLIAAMNLCSCGYRGHPHKRCTCSAHQILQYGRKIPGPLRDRIDINQPVDHQSYTALNNPHGKQHSSESILKLIQAAWSRQLTRKTFNANITLEQTKKLCRRDSTAERMLKDAYSTFGMSTRNILQTLRVARTIADLEEGETITDDHVAEALSYRNASSSDH